MFSADKLSASGGLWLDQRTMRERLEMVGGKFGADKTESFMKKISIQRAVRGWLECRLRRTDFDQLRCGQPHFDD